MITRPAAPASTTPFLASTSSWPVVRASAFLASSAARAAITARSPGRSRTAEAAVASTLSTVPSTGRDTAAVASSAALARPARRSPAPRSTSASPRSAWLTITPELPRAPRSAPCAKARHAVSGSALGGRSSRASAAARRVRWRLVPVSPSGIGKTFSASMSPRAAPSASAERRAHARSACVSSTSSMGDPFV